MVVHIGISRTSKPDNQLIQQCCCVCGNTIRQLSHKYVQPINKDAWVGTNVVCLSDWIWVESTINQQRQVWNEQKRFYINCPNTSTLSIVIVRMLIRTIFLLWSIREVYNCYQDSRNIYFQYLFFSQYFPTNIVDNYYNFASVSSTICLSSVPTMHIYCGYCMDSEN